MKIKIILTTLILMLGCGVYYYMNTQQNDPMSVVQLIYDNMNHATGEINDYAGDINYMGPESVGYEPIGDDKMRIYFGDLQFDITQEELNNEEFIRALGHIGITISQSKKTGDIIVKFHGEEVALFNRRK